MAWPLTPILSLVENSAPAWTADLGNSLQDAINKILLGTYSVKALTADGTGGAAVTPTSGTLKCSTTRAGTSAPTTATVLGEIYKDLCPLAWAFVANSGAATLTRGVNISSVTRTGAGSVTVVLMTAGPTVNIIGIVSGVGTSGYAAASTVDASTIGVTTRTDAGVATDSNFGIVVFG